MNAPTFFKPEEKNQIIDKAIEHMANGKSLLSFCEQEELTYSMVYRWIAESDRDNSVAPARTIGTHYLAEECIKLADDTAIDPQHKKIMIDTRLRLIGKWNKRDYGEQTQLDVSVTQKPDLSQLSDAALQEVMQLPAFQNLALPTPKG